MTVPKIDYEIVDGKITGSRGASIKKRWVPKEWKAEYESIVALSCTGLSNTALAERFGYTKEHISNILNTPEGQKLRRIIAARVRQEHVNSIPDRIAKMQERALQVVESVLENDELLVRSPFAIFDRAQKVLQGVGVMKPESNQPSVTLNLTQNTQNNTNNTTQVFSTDAVNAMTQALAESNKLKLLHGEVGGNIESN